MTINTHPRPRRQVLTHNPFLSASDAAAHHSAVLSTQIGLRRARKAIASVVDLWNTSPPHDRRWDAVFRTCLAELEEAER